MAEDRRRRKEIHREKEGDEKGRADRKRPERDKAERGVSQRKSVCAQCVCMCWGGNNEEGMGHNKSPTLQTQILIFNRHLWLLIRLPLIFVFPFKVIDVIRF